MEKFRRLAKRLMVMLGALICVVNVIILFFLNVFELENISDGVMKIITMCCTLSVVLGICNFALALALVGVTFLCKANPTPAIGAGIPAIGGFVTALIMTNFTNETSFGVYLLNHVNINLSNPNKKDTMDALLASVNVPIILSAVFAAAVIIVSIVGIINDKRS
ncbi:MAG: hypothetical protein K2N56_00955 [Oscillospiraceae bacterium]|nr:hypothetical protein [Oscillospiraceae bacterium]